MEYKEFLSLKIKVDKSEILTEGASSSSSQQTLETVVEKMRPLARNSSRFQKITTKIGEFIATDYQPFSIVEDDGFRKLINFLEPRFKMPSRNYFRDTFHANLFKTAQNKV